jgi:hypothetical protein
LRLIWTLVLLAGLEGWSRFLGWYDYAIKKDRYVVWDMAWSQKSDVDAERREADEREDLRPTALARKT